MKKTSRLAGAAVKQVEQYVEIHRELTEIEKLMATPPELGKPFAADGISFTQAFEHPVLGPALIDFHDCLVWPTDDEREHCEGVGTFLLVLRFAEAGHPAASNAVAPRSVRTDQAARYERQSARNRRDNESSQERQT